MQRYSKFVVNSIVLVTLVAAGRPGFARDKAETIDAQAFGTGTQMGQNIGVTLNIYDFRLQQTSRSWCRRTNRDKIRG